MPIHSPIPIPKARIHRVIAVAHPIVANSNTHTIAIKAHEETTRTHCKSPGTNRSGRAQIQTQGTGWNKHHHPSIGQKPNRRKEYMGGHRKHTVRARIKKESGSRGRKRSNPAGTDRNRLAGTNKRKHIWQ
jgi:hypothetical protein